MGYIIIIVVAILFVRALIIDEVKDYVARKEKENRVKHLMNMKL